VRVVTVGVSYSTCAVAMVMPRSRSSARCDGVERTEVFSGCVRQHLGDRRRQRRLAVVNVSNGPHVYVWFERSNFSFAMMTPSPFLKLLLPFCYQGAGGPASSPKTLLRRYPG